MCVCVMNGDWCAFFFTSAGTDPGAAAEGMLLLSSSLGPSVEPRLARLAQSSH